MWNSYLNTQECNVFIMDGKLYLLLIEFLVRNNFSVKTTENFLTTEALIPAYLIMDEDYLRYGRGEEILFLYDSDTKARYVVKILISKTTSLADGLNAGFEEVVQLPINSKSLLAILKKWKRYILKLRYDFVTGPFLVHDFVFDDRARAVFHKGKLLDLTFAQYLILKAAVLRNEWWSISALAADTRTSPSYVRSTFQEVDDATEGAWSKLFLKSGNSYRCKYVPQSLTEEEYEYFIKEG